MEVFSVFSACTFVLKNASRRSSTSRSCGGSAFVGDPENPNFRFDCCCALTNRFLWAVAAFWSASDQQASDTIPDLCVFLGRGRCLLSCLVWVSFQQSRHLLSSLATLPTFCCHFLCLSLVFLSVCVPLHFSLVVCQHDAGWSESENQSRSLPMSQCMNTSATLCFVCLPASSFRVTCAAHRRRMLDILLTLFSLCCPHLSAFFRRLIPSSTVLTCSHLLTFSLILYACVACCLFLVFRAHRARAPELAPQAGHLATDR